MVKRISDFLAGLPMTVVGVFFLIWSFTQVMSGRSLWIDPAWATVFISGIPLFYLAIWRLIYNPGIQKISSALLISIAMVAAIVIGDIFAAGEVAFIMALGAILEEKTTERAQRGLKNLIALTPLQGRRIRQGQEEMVQAEEIRVSDILRVLPGETIPADGEIISGHTSIDQAILTGESLPVDKEEGDSVFCGTLNQFGAVDIRVTKVGKDSSMQRLIRMVREAEEKKAPMQRIADQWASWLVPLALLIAILSYLYTKDVVRSVTVLVVFCPCALVLATPTAIMAAIGQATKHGVIIKSGEALEKMGKVNIFAFDKTGTLTTGNPKVTDVLSFSDHWDRKEVFTAVASMERFSEHPLGKAVVESAKEEGLEFLATEDFQMKAGRGIYSIVGGEEILCGNERYLAENGVMLGDQVRTAADQLRNEGKVLIFAASDGVCIGIVALADQLRESAKETVQRLFGMNLKIALLTGDNARTADYFAHKVGIREVRAELLPEEKLKSIESFQEKGNFVGMIGDGVNDAPALKIADVGIAMGVMGSDIAADAADIALMSDDITRLPYLKRLSDATVRTIKASIGLSLMINFAAILLSVKGWLNPTTGALVHNAGSVLVVMIAALLYDRKFDE